MVLKLDEKENPPAGNRRNQAINIISESSITHLCVNRCIKDREIALEAGALREESTASRAFSILQHENSAGVYPYVRKCDKHVGLNNDESYRKMYKMREKQISKLRVEFFNWGVLIKSNDVRARCRGGVGGAYGKQKMQSRFSRNRLIRKTNILESNGVKPSHMVVFTLPPSCWENLADDEARFEMWKRAKKNILKSLSKKLERGEKEWGGMWFVEFQIMRGAPHLHVFIDIGKLKYSEWKEWLKWLNSAWSRALGKEIQKNTVEFKRMRYKDFRYARKYASKMEQKWAPFAEHWGRWWQTIGSWARMKEVLHLVESFGIGLDVYDELRQIAGKSRRFKEIVNKFINGWQNSIKIYKTYIRRCEENLLIRYVSDMYEYLEATADW